MRHEVGAVYRSPLAPLAGPAAARTTRRALEAGPICLMPRRLGPSVAEGLDALPPDDLPRFDVSGAQDRVRAAVAAAVPSERIAVLDWLRDDILALVDLYVGATGCRTVRSRQ